jgi:uncharacterized phage-associated protein
MIPDLYVWEEEDLVQNSLEKWEEAEHPRANDGKFGIGSGNIKPGKVVHRGMGLDKIKNIKLEGIKRVKATIGERPDSVYFMTDKNDIYDYVSELYTDNDEGFAIVEFTIPDEFSKDILEDEEEGDSFRIEKDIPAEWIGNIYFYDNRGKPVAKSEKIIKGKVVYTSFGFDMVLVKVDWVEDKHPRAKDGRFGSKPGEKKQTVGGVIREKAKAMAPVIRNKQIAKIAHDHFTNAYNKNIVDLVDFKKVKLEDYTKLMADLFKGPDARNGFNNLVGYLRDKVIVDKAEFDRILLNTRNRYYQKLRAANLREIPVEVDTTKNQDEYISSDKLVDAFENHPTLKSIANKIKIKSEEYNKITADKSALYDEWDKLSEEEHDKITQSTSKEEIEKVIEEYGIKVKEAWNNYDKATDAWVTISKEKNALEKERGAACRKLLSIPDHSEVNLINFYGKKHDNDYTDEVNWLSSITNAYGKGVGTNIRMITINRNLRSYHHMGMIYLSRNAKPGTVAHEFGHCMETNIPQIRRACKVFLERRTIGEVAKNIPGYGRSERAKFDNFPDPYCGKLYNNATEILSMGIGFLYNDAADFAKKDLEYFNFVVGTLRGETWK